MAPQYRGYRATADLARRSANGATLLSPCKRARGGVEAALTALDESICTEVWKSDVKFTPVAVAGHV